MLKMSVRSTFLRHNGVFFFGSLAASILNYLYYPVLGRMLHPAAFGEVQTLVSMFLQVGIFLSVLGTLTINLMTHHEESTQRNRIILELEKFALFISVMLFVLAVIFSHALQNFFHFGDYLPFILLSLAIVMTVPFTFRSAYLRGKHKFGQVALAGIVGAGTKLLFSVALVLAGLGTTGALLGLVLAQIVSVMYAALYARRSGFHESLFSSIRPPDMRLIAPELKFALLILVCSLTITGMYSIDIIAVKHYFDAHTAGLYAGVAAVARIIFFLTASITLVMMPSIRSHGKPRDNQAMLGKSFVLLCGIGGAALLVFCLAPQLVIGHLMGKTYEAYAKLLPRLSLAVFLISVLNLFVNYHLALRRYAIAVIAAIGATVTVVCLYLSHATLTAVVNSLLSGSTTMFLALGIWIGAMNLRQHKEIRLWRNS